MEKEEQNKREENALDAFVNFRDGNLYLAIDPKVTQAVVSHNGKKYAVVMFELSRPYEEGKTMDFLGTPKIVVEKELDANGTCTGLTESELKYYTTQYLQQREAGYQKGDLAGIDGAKICRYIGRKDPNSDQMIISPKVQSECIDKYLEPILQAEFAERRVKREARLEELRKLRLEEADLVHMEHLDGRYSPGSAYDGVDLSTGDVLLIRNLNKVGTYGDGDILYEAYLTSEPDEEYDERKYTGKNVAFTTKAPIDDLIQNPKEKRKLLELFTLGYEKVKQEKRFVLLGNLDVEASTPEMKEESSLAKHSTKHKSDPEHEDR